MNGGEKQVKRKKMMAWFLAAAMLVTMCPQNVLAQDADDAAAGTVVTETDAGEEVTQETEEVQAPEDAQESTGEQDSKESAGTEETTESQESSEDKELSVMESEEPEENKDDNTTTETASVDDYTKYINETETSDAYVQSGTEVTLKIQLPDNMKEPDGVSYQWSYWEDNISEANTAIYTISSDQVTSGFYCYSCKVTDETNERTYYFYVTVGNYIKACGQQGDLKDGNSYDLGDCTVGETLTLVVVPYEGLEDLTYTWQDVTDDEKPTDLGTGTTCQVTKKAGDQTITCTVTGKDEDGNEESSETAYFSLSADTLDVDQYVDGESALWAGLWDGDSATLSVSATSIYGSVSYQWYQYTWDSEEGRYDKSSVLSTAASYTVKKSGTEVENYVCIVSDGNEESECRFYVEYQAVRNGGIVIDGVTYDGDTYYCEAGTSLNLRVTAEIDPGLANEYPKYQWSCDNVDIDEGGNTATYTIQPVQSGRHYYECTITYGADEGDYDYYYVCVDGGLPFTVNGTVTKGEETVTATASSSNGSTVSYTYSWEKDATYTLSVTPDDPENYSYQWYSKDDDYDELIESATSASYEDVSPALRECYTCTITERKSGNTVDVTFYFEGSGLKVSGSATGNSRSYEGSKYDDGDNAYVETYVNRGDTVTLQVQAESEYGGLTYQWYDDDYEEIAGATNSSYQVTFYRSTYLYCRVTDAAGNDSYVGFYLYKNGTCLHDNWSDWKTVSTATVSQPETQQRTCSSCGTVQTRYNGSKLSAYLNTNVSSLVLQKKQSTTKLVVTGLAAGDSIASCSTSNGKIVKVTNSGNAIKVKAQKKTGKATITLRTAAGAQKVITVKVQKKKVKTSSIKNVPKTITLAKGQTYTLSPQINPITTKDKTSYKSSKKKVASVSKKGVIKAKKKGTTKITVKSGRKKKTIKVVVK